MVYRVDRSARSVLYGGWGTDHGPTREMAFSVPHSCDDFVRSATAAEHPKHLYTGVPDVLTQCVQRCATTAYADLGKERTAALRKWTLRAQELREQVDPSPPSGHCAKILRGKDLRLFQEMLVQATKETCQILKANRKGANFSHKLSIVSGVTLSR